jgi:hypothetical protein
VRPGVVVILAQASIPFPSGEGRMGWFKERQHGFRRTPE